MVLFINILLAIILVCSVTAFGALAAKEENRAVTSNERKWMARFGLFSVASIINFFMWNNTLLMTTSFIVMGVTYGLVPLVVFIWNHINAP